MSLWLGTLAAALAVAGCTPSAPASAAPAVTAGDARPQAVRTAAVRVGPVREVARYVGTVRSHREVTVLAQLPGTLLELPAREGEQVEEGAVLARIASPESEARVARVRAELRRARTDRTWLCDRYETDRRLQRSGAVPKAQLDQSKGACRAGRAGVLAAEAQLREVTAVLDKAVERAPFAGQILLWHGEPGENVLPGRPVLRLGDHEREVLVRVSESDVRRGIRAGTTALLDLGARATTTSQLGAPIHPARPRCASSEWSYHACGCAPCQAGASTPRFGEVILARALGNDPPSSSRVTWVAPQASGPARALDVVVALPPHADDLLRHGMSVDVSFVLAEAPDAVAVPVRALHRGQDGDAILLVNGERIERQPVVTGVRAEGWVAVSPAPPPDSRVVVGGLETLADGARVFAVPEESRR